jgi:hypothetical protein
MTKTAATKQVRSEMHWYRQGSGWVLSTYSPHYGCHETSQEMPWSVLVWARKTHREQRIAELMADQV